MKKIIAVVGDATITDGSLQQQIAFETGKAVIDAGYRLQTGGLNGVMRYASMGAKSSKNYKEGDVIALLPAFNRDIANEYVDIAVTTGLDIMRNALVASADAVIAIGGGAGTMSELCFAWTLKRLIVAYNNIEGWSSKVADTRLDKRIRYESIFDDRVYGVDNPTDAIKVIKENIDRYNAKYEGISKVVK